MCRQGLVSHHFARSVLDERHAPFFQPAALHVVAEEGSVLQAAAVAAVNTLDVHCAGEDTLCEVEENVSWVMR